MVKVRVPFPILIRGLRLGNFRKLRFALLTMLFSTLTLLRSVLTKVGLRWERITKETLLVIIHSVVPRLLLLRRVVVTGFTLVWLTIRNIVR